MAEKKIDNMTYEEAFEELEKVVKDLEEKKNDLDKAMGLFERGQTLVKHCASLLESAELKIQELSANGDLRSFEE